MSDQTPVPTKTPWHLWTVGVLAVLWNSMGALDFFMTQTKNQAYLKDLTPEQLDYFYGFPLWVVCAWGIATWGGLIGSAILLLRRKLAVLVLLASFLAMLVTTVHNFALNDGLKAMGGGAGALVFTGVIFVIALLLLLYSRAMRKQGVLR